jgi:putative endonuclease
MKVKAYKAGIYAEKLAALYLFLCGYRILARRYKTPVGEIDLVVKRGKALVMVEVKTRRGMDEALSAVQFQGQERIIRAARFYLSANPQFAEHDIRFDIVAVRLQGWIPLGFRHLDNAWQASS